MKRILLTTTSLVLAAGVAQAEVTFSGKAEAGVSRTSKVDAVAATLGTQNTYAIDTDGTIKETKVATAADATSVAAAKAAVEAEKVDLADFLLALDQAANVAARDTALNNVATARKDLALAEAALAAQQIGAVSAVKVGDMVAYSGYDMDVSVSSTLDNGMELSAAFDMGAGSIADRDDDRVLDAQAAAVALSTVTIKNGGLTYVIGNDEIDDLYDDTQNGDVSVSGAMGGISFTLVADLDKDTKAACSFVHSCCTTARAAGAVARYQADGACQSAPPPHQTTLALQQLVTQRLY